MNVLVIGGGVVGVTTAYYLSKAGMSVRVVDSREAAGLETSAGNAGLFSPSDAFAWASPTALKMALQSLINPDMGIKYKLRLDPALWRWSLAFLGQCRHANWTKNSDSKYRLARYSLEMLDDLRSDTGIDFDAGDDGIAYACRDASTLAALKKYFSFLESRGLELELLDRDGLIEKVPTLKGNRQTYAGAVYSPTCKTGDSKKFSQNLAKWCQQNNNCEFLWGVRVEKILTDGNTITGVSTSKGVYKADAYVLAAGPHSGVLARQVRLKLPIYPIKGFSITAPIIDNSLVPSIGFDDTECLVAMSRFGNRLRIPSSAIFGGFDNSHQPKDFKAILKLARELFPDAIDYEKAEYWSGLRPMTPSSKPIIGATSISNLFLNTGHGHLGWTMSCATGKVVADIVAGKTPETQTAPFELGCV